MDQDDVGRLLDLERRVAQLERGAERDRRSRRVVRWVFLAAILAYVLYLYRVTTLL